jgi:hypothetical protein
MSEKMLVTQALDERDLLVKKIGDKIAKIKLTDCKRRNEDKTVSERLTAEDFSRQATAAYQQITDLIDRYQRIDAAIIASNAASMVETSIGRISVAFAIALRSRLKAGKAKRIDFEDQLIAVAEEQYHTKVKSADAKNKTLEAQAENMRLSILGKDSKVKDDKPLAVVDAYIQENKTEVIDPLGIEKKIAELRAHIDALIKELETQIKVSNATTFVEF